MALTKNIGIFLFGAFDGMTSVWGVVIALLSRGSHAIILAAIGLAIAAGVGMGAGEYLGDNKSSLKQAWVMMLATVFGTIVPVLPYLFLHGAVALGISIAITLALCAVIGRERDKGLRGYLETYGVLTLAGVLTAVFSLLTGSGG